MSTKWAFHQVRCFLDWTRMQKRVENVLPSSAGWVLGLPEPWSSVFSQAALSPLYKIESMSKNRNRVTWCNLLSQKRPLRWKLLGLLDTKFSWFWEEWFSVQRVCSTWIVKTTPSFSIRCNAGVVLQQSLSGTSYNLKNDKGTLARVWTSPNNVSGFQNHGTAFTTQWPSMISKVGKVYLAI